MAITYPGRRVLQPRRRAGEWRGTIRRSGPTGGSRTRSCRLGPEQPAPLDIEPMWQPQLAADVSVAAGREEARCGGGSGDRSGSAHNEAAHIRDVISGLPAIVDIVIVDDKSADDTAQLAETSSDPQVQVTATSAHRRGRSDHLGHKLALRTRLRTSAVIFAGDDQMDRPTCRRCWTRSSTRATAFKASQFSSTSYQGDAGVPGVRQRDPVVGQQGGLRATGDLFDPRTAPPRPPPGPAASRPGLDLAGLRFENDFLLNLNILSIRAGTSRSRPRYGSGGLRDEDAQGRPAIGGMLFAGFPEGVAQSTWSGRSRRSPCSCSRPAAVAVLRPVQGVDDLRDDRASAATTGTVLLSRRAVPDGFPADPQPKR